MLTADDQTMLDAYLKELAKAKAVVASGSLSQPAGPPAAPAVAAVPGGQPHPPTVAVAPGAGATAGPLDPNQIAPTVDTKQRGRWLLHEAREQLHLGNYDGAQHKVDEAEALDIKWGLFDDTPAKVAEEIKKQRPKAVASKTAIPAQPHDRRGAGRSSGKRGPRSITVSSSRRRRSRWRSRDGD